MNAGTEMFLEVYGRQKLMVQSECHLAECSRTQRLRPETSDADCWQTVWRDKQLQRERRP